MTVALTRTKVEQALSHEFEAVAAKLPGGRAATEVRQAAIGKAVRLDKPLLLVFARTATEGRLVTTRNILELGDGAHATVIEAHVALRGAAPGQANTLSDVSVGDGAHLTHTKCTVAGEAA